MVYTDRHWRAFARLIGKPDLLETDPRLTSMDIRTQNAEYMGQVLATYLPMRTTQEWIALFEANDIPVTAVNSVEDLFEDPHLTAVGLFETAEHPTEGTLNYARSPIRFGASPASVRRLAPNLGEHTEEFAVGFRATRHALSPSPINAGEKLVRSPCRHAGARRNSRRGPRHLRSVRR